MPAAGPKFDKVCPQCGKVYLVRPSGLGRVFCSYECRTLHKRGDLAEKFWANVDKRGPDECWEWQGRLSQNGYGRFPMRFNTVRKQWQAHRLAWELTNGPIPEGMIICHKPIECHNRRCCNPAHLYLGTTKENADDRILDGTNDHPERRHPKEVVETMRELTLQGLNIPQIAEKLGVGTSSVYRETKDLRKPTKLRGQTKKPRDGEAMPEKTDP